MKYAALFLCVMLLSLSALGQNLQPIDMVILLDRSGSMVNTDPDGITAPAAGFIVEQLMLANPENRVAVVPFASQAVILGRTDIQNPTSALTSGFEAVVEMLQAGNSRGEFMFRETSPDEPQKWLALLRTQMGEQGETELELALRLAGAILSGSGENRRKVIVLISDGEPYPVIRPELQRLFGHNLVQEATRERQARRQNGPNNRRLVQMYQEYILNKVAPTLRSAGIELYPIAFVGESQSQAPLIEYLKALKRRITGDEEVITANRQTLIAELIDFVPSNFNHIRVARVEPFLQGGETSRDWEITVPDIGKRIRLFLSYPDARTDQSVQVRVYQNDQLVAESRHPEEYAPLIYHEFRDRQGRLVYQSLQLVGRENAVGHFRLQLTPVHTSTMPGGNLLVDLNTAIYPEWTMTPEPPVAQEPCAGLLQLRDLETDRTFPVDQLRLVARGTFPEEIQQEYRRARQVEFKGDTVLFAIQFPRPGKYALAGDVQFHLEETPDLPLTLKFKTSTDVRSATSLEGNVWLGGEKSTVRDENFQVVLPPLGEETRTQYKECVVYTSLNRTINGLQINLPPPAHLESGSELFTNNRNWVRVSPNPLMGLSANRPVRLTIQAEIPRGIVPEIPDGIYTSEMQLLSGNQILDSVPVSLKVAIPRFVASREDIDRPYDPFVEHPPPVVERTIYYPGMTPHRYRVRLWSTTLKGIAATASVGDGFGLRVVDEDQLEKSQSVVYQVPEPGQFAIPGKNEDDPGIIPVSVTLRDPSLNGQTFQQILYVEGDRHRPQRVQLVTHIRFVPPWLLRSGFLVLLILGFVMGARWLRLQRSRSCFERKPLVDKDLLFGESKDNVFVFNYRGREIGRFDYDGEGGLIFRHDGDIRIDNEDRKRDLQVQDRVQVVEGDRIRFRARGGRFALVVEQVPTAADMRARVRVDESPLGGGRMRYVYLGGSVLLAAIGIIGITVAPYFPLKLAGILRGF